MDPGCVDEHDLSTALPFAFGNVDDALNPVPRGLGLGGNDRELFAYERIEQRGLARVGAAENTNETGAEWHKESFYLLASSLGTNDIERSFILGYFHPQVQPNLRRESAKSEKLELSGF